MADITKLTVRLDGPEGTILSVKGRVAWTLAHLLQAGERGCTPIERPAPRWSDYVFKLRKAGLTVETIDEAHGGSYSGTHARYVLRTPVEVIAEERK
ncbi:winged helix domain-containing protein [Xanthobacter autotrophicus]|uniref:winged helix domain-containing protein n=1 Tax=Xanthobacter autotrophicus TaxID=280 RepID=UPI003726F384